MARLLTQGFESGLSGGAITGTAAITTLNPRTGSDCLRANPIASNGYYSYTYASGGKPIVFHEFFFLVKTPPDQLLTILNNQDFNGNALAQVKMNLNRQIELWNPITGTRIGSSSDQIAFNTYYDIELKVDMTSPSASLVELRVNGIPVVASTNIDLSTLSNNGIAWWGVTETGSTADFLIDDIAINDNSGASQNSYISLDRNYTLFMGTSPKGFKRGVRIYG